MKAAVQVIIAGLLGSAQTTAGFVLAGLFGVGFIISAAAKWREAGGAYYSGLAQFVLADRSSKTSGD